MPDRGPLPVDVVVVGGGLAGLTAAALLARAGRQVALFERSSRLGGRGVTLNEHGFHLNLGPHAWYVGGPGTAVLRQLNVPLEGGTPRSTYAISGGRFHAFPSGFISLLTTDLAGVHGKLELARLLARLRRMDTARHDRATLQEWLGENIGDERARALVEMFIRIAAYANAPDVLSAGAGLRSLQLVLESNVRYLHGGWQRIVDALAHRAREAGARIVTGAAVAEVLHHREVEGVRLENGEVVDASAVLVAVEPTVAARLLPRLGIDALRTVPARAACLDLALASLPRPGHRAAFGVELPLYYSVHSLAADLAPRGGAVVHLAKYLHPSQPAGTEEDENDLEALMDSLQPGWRAEIKARRHLPAMTVAHAIPLASAGGLAGRPRVAVPQVPGLYLAGDWIGAQGMLANAAVASAARAASFVLAGRRRTAAVA